ncbi:MAG: TIGR00341 family protein [Bacteroidota bacterium]|nr:TIGR00341 family protein [Bacteroidota bacterium]
METLNNIVNAFRLHSEKEDYQNVIDSIDKDVVFKGTNLWVLVFAIFIASLGLNVNSTAVIIGAMLVSPLMGPIMGLGLGMAINDIALLRKSIFNYLFSAAIALITSTIYFLITPISDAHSEILARTSPNIYDVLIALFGGLAGILAASSKQKGTVIPGVAIATALMPPLCTAGYGLATLQFQFFFGAFYLFFINSVFIALATLVTTRLLKFPYKHLRQVKDEIRAKRIVWAIVILTLLPSLYLGYDIVQQSKFLQEANAFIEYEAVFPNDYLLKKDINTKTKTILLVYGGAPIEEKQIAELKSKLGKYNLSNSNLQVKQGFAYLQDNKGKETNQLSLALADKEKELQQIQNTLDSINQHQHLSRQIFKELKAQHNEVSSFSIQQSLNITDSTQANIWLAFISSTKKIKKAEKEKIEKWLKVRVTTTHLKILFN